MDFSGVSESFSQAGKPDIGDRHLGNGVAIFFSPSGSDTVLIRYHYRIERLARAGRRHDTENERAMVGARMANLIHGGQGGKLNAPTGVLKPAITIERAAELSGSSRKSIERAKPIVATSPP